MIPVVSHDEEVNYGEETWVYFLHGTRPPYFNPITLDHPGVESLLTGWFLWKYRIRHRLLCAKPMGPESFSEPQTDPLVPDTGSYLAVRGGCWDYSAHYCRSAMHSRNVPGVRINALGFRLARLIP